MIYFKFIQNFTCTFILIAKRLDRSSRAHERPYLRVLRLPLRFRLDPPNPNQENNPLDLGAFAGTFAGTGAFARTGETGAFAGTGAG
jgi:hypothetical protein